jgi:nucleoside-diphosphate-sugar epimerase
VKRILVTGAAGFIGSKVSEMLLDAGCEVIGIDNINDYYDVELKHWRLEKLKRHEGFKFHEVDVEDIAALEKIFETSSPQAVINEAARAGVRYSIENPFVYLSTNAKGCLNLLELCRKHGIRKFVLASTSSLYAGQEMPFKEDLAVNAPISPYAATKKAAEAMSYSYHYLHGLDVAVLRYFTVYGLAGRPDMSYFRFIKNILAGRPIEVFGDGSQQRDFTYIDDIARGTLAALNVTGYEVINLGNNKPEKLSTLISLIEQCIGEKAEVVYKEFHRADMESTWADTEKAQRLLGWSPTVDLEEGINATVAWLRENWHWVRDLKDVP